MSQQICVIGGGLAGGIIASQLAADGHRVTLVEQGTTPALLVPRDENWSGQPESKFTRGQGLGGSANFWHGGLITLDQTDIEGAAPSGERAKFPLRYAQLTEYYRRALELLSNGEVALEDLQSPPADDVPITLDRSRFQPKALVFPSRPFSTRPLLENARRRHGLDIRHFTVDRLVFGDAGRVTSVEGNEKSGERVSVAADVFVLCAGGFGSPKILLSSARAHAPLQSLPIGQHITDHPTGFVFKARLRSRRNLKALFGRPYGRSGRFRWRLGVKLRGDQLDLASGRNHVLYLRPAFSMRDPHAYNELKNRLVRHREAGISLREMFQLLKHVDMLIEALNFRFGIFPSVRHVAGFVFSEQFPEPANSVVLGEDGRFTIHWDVSAEHRASLQRFLDAFVESQGGEIEEVAMYPGLLDSGSHHSGGCRMAASPADGVVDEGQRVFGTTNLFVSDGSVLPYTGHANTGLTIAAFALMCRDAVTRHVSGQSVPSLGFNAQAPMVSH